MIYGDLFFSLLINLQSHFKKNIKVSDLSFQQIIALLIVPEEGIEKNEFPKMRSDLMMRAIGGLFHGLFFLGNEKKQMSRETMEDFISTFIGNYSSDE